jgi:hypothetical protein
LLIQKWFGMQFRGFFTLKKWFGTEFYSEGFSLPRNGSEQNSESFLFREMVWKGIPRFFSSAKQAEFRWNCCLFRLVVRKWQP